MTDVAFVEVSPVEAEIIARLAGKIWPVVYSGMITGEQIDYMLEWMYSPAKIRAEIRAGVVYYLIQRNGAIAGFLAFGPVIRSKFCPVHKLYIAPDFHRRGLGGAALCKIEELAAAGEADGLELRVNRGNQRAIALYQKAGFEIIAEHCADIGGGFVMDDYILRKVLKPSIHSYLEKTRR